MREKKPNVYLWEATKVQDRLRSSVDPPKTANMPVGSASCMQFLIVRVLGVLDLGHSRASQRRAARTDAIGKSSRAVSRVVVRQRAHNPRLAYFSSRFRNGDGAGER